MDKTIREHLCPPLSVNMDNIKNVIVNMDTDMVENKIADMEMKILFVLDTNRDMDMK